jgi:hypothetical protein
MNSMIVNLQTSDRTFLRIENQHKDVQLTSVFSYEDNAGFVALGTVFIPHEQIDNLIEMLKKLKSETK